MTREKPDQYKRTAVDGGNYSALAGLFRRLHLVWASVSSGHKWLITGSATLVVPILLVLGLVILNREPPSSPSSAPSTSKPAPSSPHAGNDQNDTDKKGEVATDPPAQQQPTSQNLGAEKKNKSGGGGSTGGGSSSGGGGSSGGSGECGPYPSFPGAACTGPTGNLPLYTGSIDFRTDGEVIENVEIRTNQGLNIAANDVTFRNVRVVFTGFRGEDFTMANINGGFTGTRFENCEFDGQSNVERAISGTGTDTTVEACEIHHTANGIEVSSPLLVEESYLHDIYSPAGTGWHADGIQLPYGSDNITIRHNTIILTGGETGAISAEGQGGNLADNVLIEHNLLAGGSYTLYVGPGGSNYQVINNHLSTQIWPKVGQFGAWYNIIGVARSGNVIHETGVAVNDNIW